MSCMGSESFALRTCQRDHYFEIEIKNSSSPASLPLAIFYPLYVQSAVGGGWKNVQKLLLITPGFASNSRMERLIFFSPA